MRTLILAVLACLIAAPAGAQEQFGKDDPRVREVELSNADLIKGYDSQLWHIQTAFHDQVTDGCLPRPNAIKTTLELGIRRARLNPVNEFSPWNMTVTAFGSELTSGRSALGSCYVTIIASFENWRWFYSADSQKGYYLQVPILRRVRTVLGPKSGMQSQVKENVSEIVDEFVNEILKATEK